MYKRVVLEIYLLSFILVEVCAELVELVGKHELVVGDCKTVSPCLRLVYGCGVT